MANVLGKRWPWITAALAVVAAFLWSILDVRIGTPDPRPMGTIEDVARFAERDDTNLLFLLIDTLRAEHLGCYGYHRDTSPTLDALAFRGVRFARHLAQSSWTKCSMASLWTALNPQRVGVTRYEHMISPDARMPAEILRDAGFRTAGLFRNGWVEGYFGFDQGFDVYNRPAPTAVPAEARRANPTIKNTGTDSDAVRSAVEFLRVEGDRRWVLYLHFMDVHEYLYDEDTALFGTDLAGIYDNSIRRENLVVNELMNHLAEEGHLEDTLVVISSDHGEAFGERGHEGHARRVYRESTEVPLILSFPFRLDPGVVVEQRTANVDIWPTLLELMGLPPMEDVDGVSRVPEILAAGRGEAAPDRTAQAFAHLDQSWGRRDSESAPTVAVAEDGFRYVLTRVPGGRTVGELFDASTDAGELRNVIGENPEVAERLAAVAESYLESGPPWAEVPTLELDEVQLNQLRALGYAVP